MALTPEGDRVLTATGAVHIGGTSPDALSCRK
jgi:hypothetical protein